MNRLALAVVLTLLLILACRIHVTLWFFGHPVARPPVAGLILVALGAACAVLLAMAWRSCRSFRSSPYPRVVTA